MAGEADDVGVVGTGINQAETNPLALANRDGRGSWIGLAVHGHRVVGDGLAATHHPTHPPAPAARSPLARARDGPRGPGGPVVQDQRVLAVEGERVGLSWHDD